jgi:hypothetical protein
MASDETILSCLRKIEIAYGERLAAVTDERAELYIEILGDLDDDSLITATKDYIAANEYPPKPAQLRAGTISVQKNHGQSSQFANPDAQADYRRTLYWEAMSDFRTFDPLIISTSKAMGWWRNQQSEKGKGDQDPNQTGQKDPPEIGL